MRGAPLRYTDEELAFIAANCELPRRDAHALFLGRFGRDDVAFENFKALCTRKGWKTGRTGTFAPGTTPMNKGKRCPPGKGGRHPNARRTQFKKGGLPANTKYVGHERVSVDGYVEISVDETNPYTGFGRRYVLKHRWLWEKDNGPVPDGYVLKCLDGNKLNCDPSNWELLPRGILPLLGGRYGMGFETVSPEVKPTVIAVAKLRLAVKQAKRKEGA